MVNVSFLESYIEWIIIETIGNINIYINYDKGETDGKISYKWRKSFKRLS